MKKEHLYIVALFLASLIEVSQCLRIKGISFGNKKAAAVPRTTKRVGVGGSKAEKSRAEADKKELLKKIENLNPEESSPEENLKNSIDLLKRICKMNNSWLLKVVKMSKKGKQFGGMDKETCQRVQEGNISPEEARALMEKPVLAKLEMLEQDKLAKTEMDRARRELEAEDEKKQKKEMKKRGKKGKGLGRWGIGRGRVSRGGRRRGKRAVQNMLRKRVFRPLVRLRGAFKKIKKDEQKVSRRRRGRRGVMKKFLSILLVIIGLSFALLAFVCFVNILLIINPAFVFFIIGTIICSAAAAFCWHAFESLNGLRSSSSESREFYHQQMGAGNYNEFGYDGYAGYGGGGKTAAGGHGGGHQAGAGGGRFSGGRHGGGHYGTKEIGGGGGGRGHFEEDISYNVGGNGGRGAYSGEWHNGRGGLHAGGGEQWQGSAEIDEDYHYKAHQHIKE